MKVKLINTTEKTEIILLVLNTTTTNNNNNNNINNLGNPNVHFSPSLPTCTINY